jgi:hypothetical protein
MDGGDTKFEAAHNEVEGMTGETVFVVGAPRSGTTLFRLIVDSHPQIVNPGEFDFLFDLVGDDGKVPNVDEYIDWLSTHRIFLSHRLAIDSTHSYHDLVRSFVRQRTPQNRIVALSVHRGHHKIPFFFPEAKYIHLLRDPRDVALSTIPMGWAGNVFFGVDRWIESEASWDRLAAKTDKSRILEVRYEELVTNPRDTLRLVCDFLNIDFDEGMLNYFQHSSYQPIHANSVRKWKETVKPGDLAMLEYKVSALLLDRGYDLSGVEIRKPSRRDLSVLWAGNKAYLWRFGARRYGIAIFISQKIARHFGIKSLYRRVTLATNAIDNLYLK